jgi:hypothetical protein
MISTSCSVSNCFNISLSSFGPSVFSITAIFYLTYHTCQYPTTSILTTVFFIFLLFKSLIHYCIVLYFHIISDWKIQIQHRCLTSFFYTIGKLEL